MVEWLDKSQKINTRIYLQIYYQIYKFGLLLLQGPLSDLFQLGYFKFN